MSFIRQLNLYGFCKTYQSTSPGDKNRMIYRNSNFQRDKPWLLENIRRKVGLRNAAQQVTHVVPAPKRSKLLAIHHFLQIHHSNAKKAAITMSQGEPPMFRDPVAPSPSSPGMWPTNSVTGHPRDMGPLRNQTTQIGRAILEMPHLYLRLLPGWEAQGKGLVAWFTQVTVV
ncbi:Heat shock transcription factor, X-linked member 3 [Plecturocebus cupreus]